MNYLYSIDYLRAVSVLYIVGYWHLFNYTNAFPAHNNFFTNIVTMVVLGLFVFISGLLMAGTSKKSFDLVAFYRKRLARIYPLYVLAVILFYNFGINDAATSMRSLIFISMYYSPAPLTLWFVTMLFLFYLLTPLLLELVDKIGQYLLAIIAIFAVTILLYGFFETVDLRILLYFPCYCAGIYCSRYGMSDKIVNVRSALLLFIIGAGLLVIEIESWAFNNIKYIPIILASAYLVVLITSFNDFKFKKVRVISLLSYSSYAMYLFHRPIYITLKEIYFPQSGLFQVLYLVFVGLFFVILISWGVQRLNDEVCMLFGFKKRRSKNKYLV